MPGIGWKEPSSSTAEVPANPGQLLRRSNRQQILKLLARRQFLSRRELSQVTGLTGAAVSRITRELLNAGFLRETKEQTKTGHLGRRQSMLSVNPTGACVVGVTITANKMEVALVDAGKNILASHSPPVDINSDAVTQLAHLVDATQTLIAEHAHLIKRLCGIGVAVPSSGSIADDGTISSQQMGWTDVAIARPFFEAFGLPVKVEARAMSLLRAELHQSTDQLPKSLFLVNVGLGIGCAGLLDDQFLWGGEVGFAGISHLPHPASDLTCVCERAGCLEMCASGVAVARTLINKQPEAVTAITPATPWTVLNESLNVAFSRAGNDEREAQKAFYDAGYRLGFGLDVIHSLVQPGHLFLSGATGRQAQFVEGVWDYLKETNSRIDSSVLQVSRVQSVQGAACSALDAFVFSEHLDLSATNECDTGITNMREIEQ